MQPQNAEPILIVDDEQSVLEALVRAHRKNYSFSIACGPERALELLAGQTKYAVVVSDYNMPGMDGTTLLDRVRQVSPETVRVMLTGNADMQTAVGAVNRGQVFRFLTKPCAPEVFSICLDAALEQYRLRNAERLLLEHTVRGSVRVLAEVLSLVNPDAFGRATRVQTFVRQIVAMLGLEQPWQYDTAALLSQVGWVAIPSDIIDRVAAGQDLSSEHASMLERHPEVASKLIERIPRLEPIAKMIAHQRSAFSSPGKSAETLTGKAIPLGGRILSVALDFEELASLGASRDRAIAAMRQRTGHYDPEILALLPKIEMPGLNSEVRSISVKELRVGMILDQDIHNKNEMLIVAKGNEITASMVARLRNHAELGSIPTSIRVRVGATSPAPHAGSQAA